MTATALIVDDEVDLCRLMQMTLTKMGIKSDVAYDLATARQYLAQSSYDFCLTDMRLPDGSGLDLVQYIAKEHSTMPVAVITAHGNMDIAIEALKLGAFDFVNKPLELPRLRQLIAYALKVSQEGQDTDAPTDANSSNDEALQLPKKSNADMLLDKHLIGNSPAIISLKSTIVKLARSQAPVFLWGESGTGKEVVANLIHRLSSRREGDFIAVNCGAIPSELMESEFFGHKKGSFTGAIVDKQGLFKQADGGTLFLDEVADLPLSMQVKLLRAIQEKSVRAIGDTKEVPVDVRILSATHKDLNQLVQQGQFRQDLFYRINVIELKLPTLNEREGDIELLSTYFLQQIADEWQLDYTPTLSTDANMALRHHQYEGNVRELRNLLERAITLADSETLTAEHLGLSVPNANTPINAPINTGIDNSFADNKEASTNSNGNQYIGISSSERTVSHANRDISHYNMGNIDSQLMQVGNQNNRHSTSDVATQYGINEISIGTNNNGFSELASMDSPKISSQSTQTEVADVTTDRPCLPEEGLECYLQQQERQLIIMALKQTNWNRTKAAKLLGTSFRSLRYRMKKLEIDTDEDED